jgi:hypothetical protein
MHGFPFGEIVLSQRSSNVDLPPERSPRFVPAPAGYRPRIEMLRQRRNSGVRTGPEGS